MKIKKIIVNWFYTTENGEEFTSYEVGKNGVFGIVDQRVAEDGLLVVMANGTKIKEFNINHIEYYPN